MAPYSMDLRKRVLGAWDGGLDAEGIAAKYDVNRAWVHRLVQRRRETGEIAPRRQTKFRGRILAGQEERLTALTAPSQSESLFFRAADWFGELPDARGRRFSGLIVPIFALV